MTQQQKYRIEIAKACGWVDCRNISGCWQGMRLINKDVYQLFELPDYLNSLDAMHEAEKVLTVEQAIKYEKYLKELTLCNHSNSQGKVWHATAIQRAETFIKTLNL